jgi:DNA polymerase-3 subunit delta
VKLQPRDALGVLGKPDPKRPGILIFGADAERVAVRRRTFLENLLGPNAEAEMRLTRLAGGDLRRDPAALQDAMRAAGFFPGPRAVYVEDASEWLSDTFAEALKAFAPGDAVIVAAAGGLKATSKLRKAFEGHASAYALGVYDDPPSRAEVSAELERVGLKAPSGEAEQAIMALAAALPPGDFRQVLEKIVLYKLNDPEPLTAEQVMLNAPATIDADVDALLHAVAEGLAREVGPLMARLEAQGVAATTMCIMALRHFRALHVAASDPGGPAQGVGKLKPPLYGPRRDRMVRQATDWGRVRLESALQDLVEADMSLRAAGRVAPEAATVERLFIRLAMLRGR